MAEDLNVLYTYGLVDCGAEEAVLLLRGEDQLGPHLRAGSRVQYPAVGGHVTCTPRQE